MMGAWSRSSTLATSGSTTCQVRRLFQSRAMMPTRLRISLASLFQSPCGPWRSLLIRTGALPLAAVEDLRPKEGLAAAREFAADDDQTGDPRGGHAGGRWPAPSMIAPTAVGLLTPLPVQARRVPDLGGNRNSDLAGRVQPEQ